MQDYRIKLLKDMLEAYSPSGSEETLARLLSQQMEHLGFKVMRDQVGNVIGKIGAGRGPSILLCGHMDTVPGEIPVRLEGDMLYGRGAVDAKSALAAMILGSELAGKHGEAPIQVVVAGVVCEETSSAGIKSLILRDESFDLAVFGEPSGANRIIIGYKGSLRVEVTCLTSGGHSAAPWLSKNSLEEVFEFWRELKRSHLQNDSTQKFNVLTGCVTGVQTGLGADNSIPQKATLNIDVRIPPAIKIEQLKAELVKIIAEYERTHAGVRLSIDFPDECPAYVGPPNSIAVQSFRWAIKNVIGGQVELVKKTGTGDMNLFAQTHNLPIITYGPGDSTLDHTDNERIDIREYLRSIEVYAKAIERISILYRDRHLSEATMASES